MLLLDREPLDGAVALLQLRRFLALELLDRRITRRQRGLHRVLPGFYPTFTDTFE